MILSTHYAGSGWSFFVVFGCYVEGSDILVGIHFVRNPLELNQVVSIYYTRLSIAVGMPCPSWFR